MKRLSRIVRFARAAGALALVPVHAQAAPLATAAGAGDVDVSDILRAAFGLIGSILELVAAIVSAVL